MNPRHLLFPLSILAIAFLFPGCENGFRLYPEFNTQQFDAGEATALERKQLYFLAERSTQEPQNFPPVYERIVTRRVVLPVDPAGHQIIDFSQSDPFEVILPDGYNVTYYRNLYSRLFIGSDGTIAFGDEGTGNGTLADYFSAPQISLLPVDATVEGAVVSYNLYEDSLVVTFENVLGSTFQCELFITGWQHRNLAITYTSVTTNTRPGVVGLAQDYLTGLEESEVEHFLGGRFKESDLTQDSLFGNTATYNGPF